MHARIARGRVVFGAVIAVSMVGIANASATSITDPSGSPVVAPLDSVGHLAPLPVSATGFPLRTAVYVEQCDGTSPTSPRWSPTEHCDLGTSPAPVYADANGNVTFSVSDSSHAFVPFVGESPQSIFNCNPSGGKAPNNGLPNFTDCQVRVSSNDADVTADQQFFGLQLPVNATNRPRRAPATTTTTSPHTSPAMTDVTTTTRVPGAAHGGSKPNADSLPASRSEASARRTASPADVITRPATSTGSSDSPGLLGLSDPAVTAGYLVLFLGVALAALSVRRARARSALRRSPSECAP